jgi:SAM-dependent methyltransferase
VGTRKSEQVYDAAYAAVYDTIFGSDRHARDVERLRPVLAGLAPTDRILDVGCGTGTLCRLLRDRFPRIEGLDLSPAMLATAQRKNPGVRFTVGNLLDGDLFDAEPVEDQGFALIVSEWDVLNYLETRTEYAKAFANFRRWLVPSGWLAVDILVDQVRPGEAREYGSTLVAADDLRVDGWWDMSDSARPVFRERIATATASRETAHELLLLTLDEIEGLLGVAGFAVDHNAGDDINPFLFARAV